MEGVLWYVLASSRGGPTRVRILRALADRPQNANQLAERLDLDYTTIRHHLDVLTDNNVVRKSGDEYAAVYLFTDATKSNWGIVDEILETVDPEGVKTEEAEEKQVEAKEAERGETGTEETEAQEAKAQETDTKADTKEEND